MADVDTRTTFVMVRIEVFVCCLLVRILHTRGKYPRALERIAHYRTYVRGERGEVQALNTHDCIDFLRREMSKPFYRRNVLPKKKFRTAEMA